MKVMIKRIIIMALLTLTVVGTVNSFTVINGTNSDGSLEIDGPEGSTYTSGLFTLSNGVCNGNMELKSKAQGTINNVTSNNIKIRASYINNCMDVKEDALSHLLIDGTLIINANRYCNSLYNI